MVNLKSKRKAASPKSDLKTLPNNRQPVEKRRRSDKPEESPKKVNVFHERLGTLTYYQACQLLGDESPKLIQAGARKYEIQSDRDVFLGGDLFRVRVNDEMIASGVAIVTIALSEERKKELRLKCDQCELPCDHLGAAVDYLMSAKSVLGLAMPPDESVPLENLTQDELHRRAMAERHKRAKEESMAVTSTNPDRPWVDYVVTSRQSGRTYRVAVRSLNQGDSFCTCPDFRVNHLGTCKHILHVQGKLKKRFSKNQLAARHKRKRLSIGVDYGPQRGIRFYLPHDADAKLLEIAGGPEQAPLTEAKEVLARIQALEIAGYSPTIFPDAEKYVQRKLVQEHLQSQCKLLRSQAATSPLRKELLKSELLPYQLEGIAFVVGSGRAILADDMGLGKTIQAIGAAELLARLAEIRRVLVVCPASLKSQWRSEILRFSDRDCQLVLGNGAERLTQYNSNTFFTICNYEQVLRDYTAIESVGWDLVILDEGQRIKNWESKTSILIRQIESPFRLVLSGTPLENRLGELYTVTKFVDEKLLGPAYQFFNRHHVVDARGKTQAYHRLDELREKMTGVLLRRTRSEVATQLPERTDEVIRIEATQEQMDIQNANCARAALIASKKFMTEMDRLVLMSCLTNARMACDSTYLLDQEQNEYSSKLERFSEIMEGLWPDYSRKIVIFSEWRRMLDRIEHRLDQMDAGFVRLDGQVPQRKRAELVARFQNDPDCRIICMTNAGSTGLNLQSANTVINVDLPWNPAVLEQRIARAHRMGQKNPVHVYKLVTVGPMNLETIEERLLDTLVCKQDLADAALNADSDLNEVAMVGGMENLKRQLEVILAPKKSAIDESQQRRVLAEAEQLSAQSRIEKRAKVSEASGALISAALAFAGELIGKTQSAPPSAESVKLLSEKLGDCIDRDDAGRPQLKITLPNEESLHSLAQTLASLLQG